MSEDSKEHTQEDKKSKVGQLFQGNPAVKRVLVALCIGVALVVAFICGYLVPHGASTQALGATTVLEDGLDTIIATYTSPVGDGEVSVREVIEQTGSLEESKNQDGSYTLPGASSVLVVVRNKIFATEAENRGIEVKDADLADYAEQTLGNREFAAIAKDYGMSEEGVKDVLRNAVLVNKLHDEIVGPSTPKVEAPKAPEEPGEGKEDVPSKNYADYIFALAGAEWDVEKGEWKSDDGPYATALANYEVTADGATFEAAQTAYYVAYQNYTEQSNESTAAWSDFVNDLTSNATISISTLVQ